MPTNESPPEIKTDEVANDAGRALLTLQEVLASLLAPDGCPWDKEQTPESLCEYLIEETHELVDAVRNGTPADVRGELGDVFFLLIFVAALYAKQAKFNLADVFSANAAKMIRRHPHVFAGEVFASQAEQLKGWDRIKKQEKAAEPAKKSGVFTGLPGSLPPLTKAYRIHAKAAGAGFTWDDDEDVERQVEAEWLEFLDASAAKSAEGMERELGDMIFTLAELGRRKGIKAAAALDSTCNRFLRRFQRMEELAAQQGNAFADVDMEEKNALWERVKAEEA